MIVGGLGGIGRVLCRWMVQLKARNIIILSRSGLKSTESFALAKELRDIGVRLAIYACDVSDAQQLKIVLNQCKKEMPPIRGLIQSAMALKVNGCNFVLCCH